MAKQEKVVVEAKDVAQVRAEDIAAPALRTVETVGERWNVVRPDGVVHAECPKCLQPRTSESCDDCAVESALHRRTRGNRPRVIAAAGSFASHAAMGSEPRLAEKLQAAMAQAVQDLLDQGVDITTEHDRYRNAQLAARASVMAETRA